MIGATVEYVGTSVSRVLTGYYHYLGDLIVDLLLIS